MSVSMVFQNLCALMRWTKVALALEGLKPKQLFPLSHEMLIA